MNTIDAYRITFAPGKVRHLVAQPFFAADINSMIELVSDEKGTPHIEGSFEIRHEIAISVTFDARHISDLVGDLLWQDQLRVHHAIGCLFVERMMPSAIYAQFHLMLQLGKHFAITECAEAWVPGTWEDWDIAQSFEASPNHLFVELRPSHSAVFEITPFVRCRLNTLFLEKERIDKEAMDQAEQARLEAETRAEQARLEMEARQASAQAARLKNSRFSTYVYLMEDTRNGRYKIGRSRTPEKRERTLQSETPTTVLRFCIPAEEEHELALHARFSKQRLRGEWFDLNPPQVAEVISYLKVNGDCERMEGDFQWIGLMLLQAI